jgi:hypothetical protein
MRWSRDAHDNHARKVLGMHEALAGPKNKEIRETFFKLGGLYIP